MGLAQGVDSTTKIRGGPLPKPRIPLARYAVCGKKGTYHFCVSMIPSIRYAVRQNESLHVANLYEST